MARRLRLQYPGAIYHVWSRGVDARAIYLAADDRERFQLLLADVLERHRWSCLAYCQMTTHYHLLVQTTAGDLGTGMKRLNGCYAQWFNRRHARKGHLFESRYDAALVQTHAHLLAEVRYLALNPVEAGICRDPLAWEWSSYAQTVRRGGRGLVPTRSCLVHFGRDRREAATRLEAFVRDGFDPRSVTFS